MLVIDDSKLKLLKMKEKMLSLATGDKDKTLSEYQKLAIEIDAECYKMITDKIKNSNYNNLPFEEEIKFFDELIEDYVYLDELQHRLKKEFAKYSDYELVLSDLSKIKIDEIRAKNSQIEGYLVNIKNLKSNKMELDRLNQVLVSATTEEKHNQEIIKEIKRKLKNDVLNAKGRIQNNDGSLEITSINLELKNFGYDLNMLSDDMELVDEAYGAAKKEKDEINETLNIALDLPNKDDTICSMYMNELLKANYKFNLLELVKEVFTDIDSYDLFKDSLYKIEDLIKEIKNGLRELKIKFYINPFDYIKIKDYIAMFENIRNPYEEIENTKKTITYLAGMIDDMERANNEFLLTVNDDVMAMEEDAQVVFMDIEETSDKDICEILKAENAKDNQVVMVSDTKDDFNMGRVKEKTRGVISRVYEMMNPKEKNETIPELVIEKAKEEPTEETIAKEVENVIDLPREEEPFEKPMLFDARIDGDIFDDIPTKEEKIEPTDDNLQVPEVFWEAKEEINKDKQLRR